MFILTYHKIQITVLSIILIINAQQIYFHLVLDIIFSKELSKSHLYSKQFWMSFYLVKSHDQMLPPNVTFIHCMKNKDLKGKLNWKGSMFSKWKDILDWEINVFDSNSISIQFNSQNTVILLFFAPVDRRFSLSID